MEWHGVTTEILPQNKSKRKCLSLSTFNRPRSCLMIAYPFPTLAYPCVYIMVGCRIVEESFKIHSCSLNSVSGHISIRSGCYSFTSLQIVSLLLQIYLQNMKSGLNFFDKSICPHNDCICDTLHSTKHQSIYHHHHTFCHSGPANAADMNPGLTTGCSSEGDQPAWNDQHY